MNKTNAVTITVANGKVVVDPESCVARFREDVTWKCNLPFVVHFGDVSPLNQNVFKNKNFTGTVHYDAEHLGAKKFRYLVAVSKDGEILITDPDLDIRP